MFGYRDGARSRRLGGPLLLSEILPNVVEELHEVYVARGGPTLLDRVRTVTGAPSAEERVPASFSKAA